MNRTHSQCDPFQSSVNSILHTRIWLAERGPPADVAVSWPGRKEPSLPNTLIICRSFSKQVLSIYTVVGCEQSARGARECSESRTSTHTGTGASAMTCRIFYLPLLHKGKSTFFKSMLYSKASPAVSYQMFCSPHTHVCACVCVCLNRDCESKPLVVFSPRKKSYLKNPHWSWTGLGPAESRYLDGHWAGRQLFL